MRVSVVIPTFNEGRRVQQALLDWQSFRELGNEVILVDGGSHDHAGDAVQELADRVLTSDRGRAVQMNAGAAAASGDVLLFCHVDTELLDDAKKALRDATQNLELKWGFFEVRLDAKGFIYRTIESLMNWRSALTSVATGDQCLFIKRDLFGEIGGFANIELMEDIAISKMLRKKAKPMVLRTKVRTSARRWQRNGVMRTIATMWFLRAAYVLGVTPKRLQQIYYGDVSS